MIIFFCIYSIRSQRQQTQYGNNYYGEGAENYKMKEKKIEDSVDYLEFNDSEKSSEFDKSSQDNSDKTFEKVF
jgi:hypothetical protein